MSSILDKALADRAIGNPNLIVDGNFDFWYEGTSSTNNGYGAATMWRNKGGSGIITMSQYSFVTGQGAVPSNPKYGLQMDITTSDPVTDLAGFGQNLENLLSFSDKTFTLSFYAKADAPKDISIERYLHYGSGGTPSSNETAGFDTLSLTTEFKKYKVTFTVPNLTGKTVGTNEDDNLQINFWLTTGSNEEPRVGSIGQKAGTYQFSHIKLEEGQVATDGGWRSLGEETQLINRYYQTLHQQAYQPFLAHVRGTTNGTASSTNLPLPYGKMRATPSVSLSNTTGSLVKWSTIDSTSYSSVGTIANDFEVLASESTFSYRTTDAVTGVNNKLSVAGVYSSGFTIIFDARI